MKRGDAPASGENLAIARAPGRKRVVRGRGRERASAFDSAATRWLEKS
jgi:hypothetical protein